jgi:acyl-CoA reductase-like NAD-dependent aldehyde dehydrogenase
MQQNEGGFVALQQNVIGSPCRAARLGRDQPAEARARDDEVRRLLHRDMDKLAEALSREHGKTIPDAKGDVQRGLEVVEFCIGAPHLLKGEYTDSAGPGIDMYSMRQPLGVAAGITPFNFPAMIPMWKLARRSPAATPSSSSRRSATRPCR